MSEYGRRGGGRRGDFEDDYDYELPRGNAGEGGARRRTREEDYDRRGGGGGDQGGPGTLQRLDSIQDPGKRYMLNDIIGSGVCGDVYEAVDSQAGKKNEIFLYTLCVFIIEKKTWNLHEITRFRWSFN